MLTDSLDAGAYWRKLKQRMKEEENAHETVTKCHALRMTAADGKQRLTDAADAETLLRIIQSVPSPKAEPIKQWLARVGAQRLDTMTRPIDAIQAHAEAQTMTSPGPNAPLQEWLGYHEQMAAFLRRQLAYETQLADAQAQLNEHDERLDDHDAQLAVLHSWGRSPRKGATALA